MCSLWFTTIIFLPHFWVPVEEVARRPAEEKTESDQLKDRPHG